MKFTRKPIVIEAFQAGVDDIPDWFMDKVTSKEVILLNEEEFWCHMMRWTGSLVGIKKGDYIINGIFPFATMEPVLFKSAYKLGDITEEHSDLMLEIEQAIGEWNLEFNNKEEVYNSLHEDLRDLRRAVKADRSGIPELLFQIGVTALKARKDLYNGDL